MSWRQWVVVIMVAALVAGVVTMIIVGPQPSGYACVEPDHSNRIICGGEVQP